MVKGCGEQIQLYCESDKEAAKLFGLYLDHKVSLPKIESNGEGIEVHVEGTSSNSVYKLWLARHKIYAEAIYFQSVSF